MSCARSRNKLCLSLDGSASSSTAYLHRWSEVVPPKSALTFAALWDPEEGMVTFSGAELLEPGMPPHCALDADDVPQLVPVDRDADGVSMGEPTATLATFQDAFDVFLHCIPLDPKEHVKPEHDLPRCLQTRASSTFDGLDVYSHDVQLKPTRSMQLSCMDLLDVESTFRIPCEFGRFHLMSNPMLDAYRSDSESESSSVGGPMHLKSRFSTTTTSTSNYVDVTDNAFPSAHLLVPDRPTPDACVSPAGSWPYLPHRRRVLRKRRPGDGDVTPTVASSVPGTPRKTTPRRWLFPSPSFSSPSPSSASTPATVFSSSALVLDEDRRAMSPRLTGGGSTATSPPPTPPATPSKRSRFQLRLSLRPRWRASRTSSIAEGWVCIEVTPIIQQRYVADLGDD